jgi:hypothetical protein
MMNIYQKVSQARIKLQSLQLKKTGENKFAGFKYYELADFIPQVNSLFNELGLFAAFNIKDELATLTIIDTDKPESAIQFTSPIADAQIKGTTPVQSLGGVHTYLKRYLYVNALEIVEADSLDANVGSGKLTESPATKTQIDQLIMKLTPERLDKMLAHYGVEKLEDLTLTQASQALKKLNG